MKNTTKNVKILRLLHIYHKSSIILKYIISNICWAFLIIIWYVKQKNQQNTGKKNEKLYGIFIFN